MIKERFMVTGKRLDNGETVTGYLYRENDRIEGYVVNGINSHFFRVDVDPETVEPVAVKPIIEQLENCKRIECPNCGKTWAMSNNVEIPAEYCRHCGQRLCWEVE